MIAEITNSVYQNYALFGWREIPTVKEATILVQTKLDPLSWRGLSGESQKREWRADVIKILDSEIDLSRAVCVEKNKCAVKESLYKVKSRNAIYLRQISPIASLDKDMQVKDQTLAYKISKLMADEDFDALTRFVKRIAVPSDMENIAMNYCKDKLPLDYPTFFQRLKKKDAGFWDELFRLIKRMAGITADRIKKTKWQRERQLNELKEILENDSAVDTMDLLYDRISKNKFSQSIENAVHFRNHIWAVCKNKYFEAERRYLDVNTDSMEDTDINDLQFDAVEETDFSKLVYDVNINNEYEVRLLLAYILLNQSHHWYKKLTQKEKQIHIFNAIYVEEMTYKEFVEEESPQLGEIEVARVCTNYRQSVGRIKLRLEKRLYKLIEDHNKEGYYGTEM